jgi:DNA-directed RNA polymerase specialized sigma24 family protein
MPISPDTLAAARRLSAPAVAEVLREHYPSVHRLAYGLAGRADVGAGIVRYVMQRSIAILPTWEDENQPENWFHHFTVITARRSIGHRPDPRTDLLLGDTGVTPDPAYIAFLAGLRAIPQQQQEAFILHTCERLGPRTSSLAMDCSTEAAGNHLRAAIEALRFVSGDRYETFATRAANAYRRLTPPPDTILPRVKSIVRRRVWPRRMARFLAWIVLLGAIGGAAWVVYAYRDRVEI